MITSHCTEQHALAMEQFLDTVQHGNGTTCPDDVAPQGHSQVSGLGIQHTNMRSIHLSDVATPLIPRPPFKLKIVTRGYHCRCSVRVTEFEQLSLAWTRDSPGSVCPQGISRRQRETCSPTHRRSTTTQSVASSASSST
jgi:hypothetical protein